MAIAHEIVENVLQVQRNDGVLVLTKINAESNYGMSLAMLKAMTQIIEGLRSETSIRAVIVDAAGKGFHAGAVAVTELKPDLTQLTRTDFEHLVHLGQSLGRHIAALPIPVIGIVRAGALGGGLELLLRSDFLYCVDTSRFSFPEVTLGFVAAWGGTQWAGRLMPFRKAQEFLLLGEPIPGKTAEEFGLVTRSFPDEAALDAHIATTLSRLRLCSPAALRWTKECLRAIWNGPIAFGEQVESQGETEAMSSGDFLKGIAALQQRSAYDYVSGAIVKK